MLYKNDVFEQQSLGDEAKGIIRFTPTAEDRGKRLSCRARNGNLSRSYSDSGTELSGTVSGAYIPDQSKEDSRILLIHGEDLQLHYPTVR